MISHTTNLVEHPEWVAERILRFAKIIDGAGHWVQQEAPGDVNAALLAFLTSLD